MTTVAAPSPNSTTTVEDAAPLGAPPSAPPVAAPPAKVESAPEAAAPVVPLVTREELDRLRGDVDSSAAQAAQKLLDEKAQAAGFRSAEDMFRVLSAFGQPKADDAKPAPGEEQKPAAKDSEEQKQPGRPSAETLAALKAESAQAKAEAAAAKQRLAALEAEVTVRSKLASAGVADVDYALALLQREVVAKKGADFDDAAWLSKLKSEKPYLFHNLPQPKPANSGVPNAAPSPPAPAGPANGGGGLGAGVMDLGPTEWQAYLAKRGLPQIV